MRWMVAVWVALVASGLALAFAARGAGPLPGDLALSHLFLSCARQRHRVAFVAPCGPGCPGREEVAGGPLYLAGEFHGGAGRGGDQATRGASAPDGRSGAGLRYRGELSVPQHHRVFRRSVSRHDRIPDLAGTVTASRCGRHVRGFAAVAPDEWPLARVRRSALGDRRPRRLASGWRLAHHLDSPPPLVGPPMDGSRRSYEKKKASAAMT
jgi:hypothetical protein